jgi:O-antigen/teichoic acid export membrane protein
MIIFSIADRFILDYYNIDSYYTYFLMSSVASIQMMLGASMAPMFMASLAGDHSLNPNVRRNINLVHFVLLLILFIILSLLVEYKVIELNNSWVQFYLLLSVSSVLQANYIYRVQALIGISSYIKLVKISLPVAVAGLVLNFVFVPFFGALTAGIVSLLSSLIILYKIENIIA